MKQINLKKMNYRFENLPILKPYFDLSFSQAERMGNLNSTPEVTNFRFVQSVL